MVFALLVGLAAIVGGGGAAYYGYHHYRRYELITETPTTDARQIREEGRVELTGRIADAGDAFQSPIARDGNAVLAGWKAEDWNETGDHSSWSFVAEGIESVPFVLDDGSGEVEVYVGDYVTGSSLSLDRITTFDGVTVGDVVVDFEDFEEKVRIAPDDTVPESIRDLVSRAGALTPQRGSITNLVDFGKKHGERRYFEETLRVGDEIYVLGYARPREGATRPLHPEDVIVSVPPEDAEDDLFLISGKSKESLVSGSRLRRLALPAGLLAVGFGVFQLVTLFGAL